MDESGFDGFPCLRNLKGLAPGFPNARLLHFSEAPQAGMTHSRDGEYS